MVTMKNAIFWDVALCSYEQRGLFLSPQVMEAAHLLPQET
jgi:hypothetical protein